MHEIFKSLSRSNGRRVSCGVNDDVDDEDDSGEMLWRSFCRCFFWKNIKNQNTSIKVCIILKTIGRPLNEHLRRKVLVYVSDQLLVSHMKERSAPGIKPDGWNRRMHRTKQINQKNRYHITKKHYCNEYAQETITQNMRTDHSKRPVEYSTEATTNVLKGRALFREIGRSIWIGSRKSTFPVWGSDTHSIASPLPRGKQHARARLRISNNHRF